MKRLLWQLYISNIGQIAIKLYCFIPKDNEMFFILKHTFSFEMSAAYSEKMLSNTFQILIGQSSI